MAAKSISIPVTGNTAPLRKSLASAERQLQRFSKQANANLKSSAAAFAVAGGAAAAAATRIFTGFEKAEQANDRVLQIAKSMALFGAETGKVTLRLTTLADQLERETGATAESIKETQAKLLTFKQIAVTANEAGGAFDRATKAAIDLAAAGFGEVTTNAVQLGKALNDPIKGITALARSGVSFTDVEKEKIRTLVESNKMLEAQGVILSAIETQVQGTAAATLTGSTKMKNAIGEITDEIGAGLEPAFIAMTDLAVKFSTWAAANGPTVAAVATSFGLLAVAITGVKAAMAVATAASAAYAFAQTGLAAATLSVQIATGIGIATAIAAAGVIAVVTKKVYDNAKAHRDASAAALMLAGSNTILITSMEELDKFVGPMSPEQRKAITDRIKLSTAGANAEKKAKIDAAKAAAKAATEAEKKRFTDFKEKVKQAQDQLRAYVKSIADAINSEVSLGKAFSDASALQADAQQQIIDEQKSAESDLTDALKERSKAYADLHQTKVTGDAKKYGAALEMVAAAEAEVAKAQNAKNVAAGKEAKPKNYSQIFAEQIAAAKNFATSVKQLVQAGLGRSGLQQILDLGPVAGAQVAKDLLAGASGMTVGSLNADLADLEASGLAAGMAIPGMSEAIGAEAFRAAPNEYYITIEAGMSAPTDIAKTVESVLQTYGATQGGIAVATKAKKAAPKKKPKKK
jgi:hypothetical protein